MLKKILVLVMLAMTICSVGFAWHPADGEEFREAQKTYAGAYYEANKSVKKGTMIMVSFKENRNVTFTLDGKWHTINSKCVEVDYNEGLNVLFEGSCLEKGHDGEAFRVRMSESRLISRGYPEYYTSITVTINGQMNNYWCKKL